MNHDHLHLVLTTLVAAVFAGVMLVVIARRFNVPAIILLLIGGILLGPVGLGLVQPEILGGGLRIIVLLAVGLILFEGGLTLDLQEYQRTSGVIKKLLTLGVLATWLITAGAIWLISTPPFFTEPLSAVAENCPLVSP